MPDLSDLSPALRQLPAAKSPAAVERIRLAKNRILSILDREIVAHQRTLEQKIAEQGPVPQQVDPHLIGLAIKDLLALNRLQTFNHPATRKIHWYANIGTKPAAAQPKLDQIAPLYDSVSQHGFGNLTGDALELIVYKCLDERHQENRAYPYLGSFDLIAPKTNGRYRRIPPPKAIASRTTNKEADFIQFGYKAGPLCIECKNYREWIYPARDEIKELIIKANDLDLIPVLIARRFHYTTIANFLRPAGIIAHETLVHYYPADLQDVAERVRHKRSLGFTDVQATEVPHPRTRSFFFNTLPQIVPSMAKLWKANQGILLAYAQGKATLTDVYREIGTFAAYQPDEGDLGPW